MWQDLTKIIAALISQYQQLKQLNEEKRQVLVLVNLSQLEKLTQREDAIVKQIQHLEDQRQQIINQLAGVNIKITPDMQMRDVWMQCQDMKQRELLKRSHYTLSSIVSEVQELQANNKIIITAALDAVNFKLNQLGGLSVEPTYGKHGQEIMTHEKNFDVEA